MIIAGGSYLELCRYPYWDRLFGSGLRAALALQHLSPATELFTYAHPDYADDVRTSLAGAGLKGQVSQAIETMRFEWLHPYQLVEFPDPEMKRLPPIEISGPSVLRFGMLEGTAKVSAERVVYSLQNETEGFFANGSKTDELIMVASERELARMLPDAKTASDRVAHLFDQPDYAKLKRLAVLVRNDLGDVTLYQRGGAASKLASYAAESYFKIGSGDVFAAGFAHAWLEEDLTLEAAADRGARSLAWFVQDARLPLPGADALPTRRTEPIPDRVRILGSDTVDVGQLVVATADWLDGLRLGLSVELDLHLKGGASSAPTLVLIGANATPYEIAELANSSDAASRRVVFSNGADWLEGIFPGAMIVGDYATALYHLLRSPSA